MVNFDLPSGPDDVDRWIVQRVLSAGATLHHEATTLLAEDPLTSGPGALVHHSILAAIANGSVTAGSIARRVGRQVSNLAPALNRLVESGFVVRHDDPLRDRRPLYAITDPYLQFHYAVLDPHRALLRDRDPMSTWLRRLRPVFDSQVRGPVFEGQARTWVRRFCSDRTLPAGAHVGPSSVSVEGTEHELDVVVAGDGDVPSQRPVLGIGEAKAGESLGLQHLSHLERVRAAFGSRAVGAKLLLFGSTVDDRLTEAGDETGRHRTHRSSPPLPRRLRAHALQR